MHTFAIVVMQSTHCFALWEGINFAFVPRNLTENSNQELLFSSLTRPAIILVLLISFNYIGKEKDHFV